MANKTLYVVGGIVVLLVVGWFLTRGPVAVSGVDVDRNLDGSTTYSNEEGEVTVGTTATMPSNWPSDAPANFAGASIVYSGTSNPQTGKVGSAVSYSARATVSSVADYYKTELTSKGWKIEATANIAGATVVSATKDTRTFGAYIADTGEGNVSVTAGIEL